MWTRLCPWLNAAGETTNESSTWSNGLTIRNARIGRKNHSTTSQYTAWGNSGSFTNIIQTHRKTTGSPRTWR